MVYPIGRFIVPPIVNLWCRKVIGLENVPKDKAFIIAANHSSYLDDFSVTPPVMRRINKKAHMYCNDRFYKNKFLAAFLKWAGCIPVSIQTKNKEVNKRAFKTAIKYLKKGEPVGIFPEGGRTLDGNLRKAKTGIAKLALTSKIPVLPIGIIGSYDVFPKGAKFPKFKRFDIKIGKLIYFDKYYGKENNKKTLRLVTTKIMKEIAKLTKQKYKY
jgi:1-acyl-sn-glycerol-3-phosphate acyltransferase